MSCWQTQWNECENYKLCSILPIVKDDLSINTNTRRDEVLIRRCLMGHTRLTHLHLLLNKPAPVCERCQHPLAVKHFIYSKDEDHYVSQIL